MAKMNVKKGDNVMIIAGKDKGKAGEVLAVYPDDNRVVVSGANEISKHVKPRKAQDKGGIVKKEGTINSSNVMIICPACNEVVRVNHKTVEVDGKTKKIRVCNKCGASLEDQKLSAKKAAKKVAKKTPATKAKKAE
jgi:ribosomal protein L24, bacterial/organelle